MPSPLLTEMRNAIRVRHYSMRTERAYVDWVKRYVRFHGLRHPSELGTADVARFLTWLATGRGGFHAESGLECDRIPVHQPSSCGDESHPVSQTERARSLCLPEGCARAVADSSGESDRGIAAPLLDCVEQYHLVAICYLGKMCLPAGYPLTKDFDVYSHT